MREASVAGSGPSTTVGQTGIERHIVLWVNSAWMDIQRRHNDWLFMRGSFTVNTTASDGVYAYGDCTDTSTSAAIAAFRDWHRDTIKIYLTSSGVAGEALMEYIDYPTWYSVYNTGQQTDSYPRFFTTDYSKRLVIAPKPDGIYTVSGEYQKNATELSGDSDTPDMPEEFHDAIWYRALMKYARYYSAPEIYDDARFNYDRIINEMEITQMPEIMLGGPIV
jgi:hypothetical protein